MDFLSNPWIVGIGSGIPSGLFVTFVARYFLSRRDNREYIQKIFSANREVIYAIRPGISEGGMPTLEVVKGLINATARKFAVSPDDLYDAQEIAEELMKEVMDSSFISPKIKISYCKGLASLTKSSTKISEQQEQHGPQQLSIKNDPVDAPSLQIYDYRKRTTTLFSAMAGMLTLVMTVIVAFTQFGDRLLPDFLRLLLPAFAVLATMLITMISYVAVREMQRQKREHERRLRIRDMYSRMRATRDSDNEKNERST